MSNSGEVRTWYNSFAGKQIRTGVNLRHYSIINELISGGLGRNSNVLEVGCGVGTLTGLIHKYVKRGHIVAADISDESVAIASNRFAGSSRIEFVTTDMSDFRYNGKFDFIVLPDVLEHIPVEQHRLLFATLSEHMHDGSKIFINLPHPKALDYIREHTPGLLQIIDQSVRADSLLSDVYANGLTLISYNSVSIYDREADYAMIWLKRDTPVTLRSLPGRCIVRNKLIGRIGFFLARL